MRLPIIVGLLLSATIAVESAQAQITPDGTLPENSITQQVGATTLINGGTTRGGNLFHSFEQFSVPTGGQAFFNNALTIQNILTRVTGRSPSSINGFIGANGTANLFFINPNGIIFGPNASFGIGGSLVVSTANQINFPGGAFFSATRPSDSLLVNTVPIGLGFGETPSAAIEVQGTGHIFTNTFTSPIFEAIPFPGSPIPGIINRPGGAIALIGGDVRLQNGVINAPGGSVEVGSVRTGQVNLQLGVTPSFEYSGAAELGDISLRGLSAINTSGFGGGAITVTGRDVSLADGSMLLTQNLGGFPGGRITVNGTRSITLTGSDATAINPRQTPSNILAINVSEFNGGSVAINTPFLSLQNGGGD